MSTLLDQHLRAETIGAAGGDLGQRDVSSFVASLYLCTWIVLLALLSSNEFLHWFVLPVWACGVLIGTDVVDWIRQRTRTFDPIGIIGLLGFHFFFLAPLLHVHWDYWVRYVKPPTEWRPWLGWMAILNLAGLLIYRYVRTKLNPVKIQTSWRLDRNRFPMFLFGALLFTLLLQAWVYVQYGGISGYVSAYEARFEFRNFDNMGWIFTFSESFPILLAIGYAYYVKTKGRLNSWFAISLFLLLFFITRLLFGGLRGSRSNTIWALFWAVGIIHLWVRPLSRKMIVSLGVPLLLVLMFMGGLYKSVGSGVVDALGSASQINQVVAETGRDLETVLLADLGRSDIQAMVLSRLIDQSTDYELALGRTYIGTASKLVPESMWPDRPPSKVKEGTDILYGRGTYASGVRTSRVYGLAGETILNFGPWLVPIAFAFLGLVVSAVRAMVYQLSDDDSRLLLLPLAINLGFLILVSDSDNILFFIIKNGFLPTIFVLISSTKVKRAHPA